ncbi:MAG: hypothetical protein ACR2M7_00190, partial [Bdellovibrionales bacterium]
MKRTKIEAIIKNQFKGKIFSYSDIIEKLSKKKIIASRSTIIRALKNLKEKNKINLVRDRKKGLYYIPTPSEFGLLKPRDGVIQRKILKNKLYYVTGIALYNQLNLTTQYPRVIRVAILGNKYTKKITVLNVRIKTVVPRCSFKPEDIKYLQYLDALNLKRIPDLSSDSISILRKNIKKMDKRKLIKISDSYPPRVRALLGALI